MVPTLKPGSSLCTTNALIPLAPFEGSVEAITVKCVFTWAPVIKTVKVPGVPADEYDAKKQFAGKPSLAGPPLDAWQEYTQVLMQSNEFLFVD